MPRENSEKYLSPHRVHFELYEEESDDRVDEYRDVYAADTLHAINQVLSEYEQNSGQKVSEIYSVEKFSEKQKEKQ